jgi:hypothetical protein
MISASTTNAPNPPPELAPDLLMPQNVRRPTDKTVRRADAESHCNAIRGAILRLLGDHCALQIRLDSGQTSSGSYRTIQPRENRGGVRPFDAWFRVGASLRCLYNPTNSDQVLVFPFAAKGDHVTYNEIAVHGPDHVWFWSAT